MKQNKILRAALLAGVLAAGLAGCKGGLFGGGKDKTCLLYTSPSPPDRG